HPGTYAEGLSDLQHVSARSAPPAGVVHMVIWGESGGVSFRNGTICGIDPPGKRSADCLSNVEIDLQPLPCRAARDGGWAASRWMATRDGLPATEDTRAVEAALYSLGETPSEVWTPR